MDAEIIKSDGSTHRLSDLGIVYDFIVSSISIESFAERMDGRAGTIDYGADYGVRSISVPMKFKAEYVQQYAHLRDKLYGIITDTEPYYIRELRRPKFMQYDFVDFGQKPKMSAQTDNEYVNGKQYQVRLASTVDPDQIYLGGEVTLEFETVGLPFAETIYTTRELSESGLDAAKDKYGLVDDINQDYTKYVFTSGSATNNVSDREYKNGSLSTGTGAESAHADRVITTNSIGVSPNRGYEFEDTTSDASVRYWIIYEYDNSGNFIKFSSTNGSVGNQKVKFYNEGRYIKLMAVPSDGVTLDPADVGVTMTPLFRVDSRTTNFSVWNAGNVTIEPEFMDLEIRLNYTYTRTGVIIKNITTDETFTMDVDLNGSHVVLDGMDVKYGDINGLRKSNRQHIKLVPGLNEFEIETDMFDEAIIDFRYYYK